MTSVVGLSRTRGKDNSMKITAAFIFLCGLSTIGLSQAKQPSTPSTPFYIKSKAQIEQITKELEDQKGNLNKDIVPAKGAQMRVAVFHDEKRENDLYEVHDGSDDIYYVLDGEATLALGGELVEPNEISPGEWRSKTVKGGNPFEIKKGDLIVVPRGTVHQRTATGKGFSMILIKVFATKQ
jgi:mannose-6-phosphate isomerase-like protein (cupin superfamily)